VCVSVLKSLGTQEESFILFLFLHGMKLLIRKGRNCKNTKLMLVSSC